MSRHPTASTGQARVLLFTAIVLVGMVAIADNAALGQEGAPVEIRECTGDVCSGIEWCIFRITSFAGADCPPEIIVGVPICIGPCVPPGRLPCINATEFVIRNRDCTFIGDPDPTSCEDECPPPIPQYIEAAAIPTVSEWGVIITGVLILAAAVIVIRRAVAGSPGLTGT